MPDNVLDSVEVDKEDKLILYRCHTGYGFTASTLLAETTKVVGDSFWKSIRSWKETIIILEQSGKLFAEGGNQAPSEQFFTKVREVAEQARKADEMDFHKEKFSEDSALPN